MGSGHKDGIAADTVHVDACASLNIIQVDVAILGDQVNHIILRADLHGHREIILCLWWEEDVHCFLGVGLVA